MTIAVTYTFSNGTTSSATEINVNYQDLIDGITDGTEPISVGQLTVAGATALNGNTTIGNASSDDLTITASLASTIAIKTNNSYGIGGAALGVTGVYFSSHADYTTRLVFGSGAANITWTMPGTNGTANQGLINNGSGTWAYANVLNGDSEVIVSNANGHGSTGTKVRRFSSFHVSTGSAISYSSDTSMGDRMTINEAGIYSISYSDAYTAGTAHLGISKNATTATANSYDLIATQLAAYAEAPANTWQQINVVIRLAAGDIIRAHTGGNNNGSSQLGQFRVCKIGQLT